MQSTIRSFVKHTCRFGTGSHALSNLSKSVLLGAAILFAASAIAPATVSYAESGKARITGMAHMAYYVSDMKKARDYYERFLGFQEAYTLKNPDGSEHVVVVKINDRQYIELYNEAPKNHGFIHDAGFETNDAKGMRDHLAAIGVQVPATVAKDESGNLSFEIVDNSGFTLQIIQYMPKSKTDKAKGKLMPATRISTHIDHLGLLVNDRESAWKFYGDAFGFIKEGDGSKMKVPDSDDRFELGVEKKTPVEARFHIKDHICLSNTDVPKMTADLKARPQITEFPAAIADIHQLGSGKNVIEVYDLDKNRVDVMEPPKGGEK